LCATLVAGCGGGEDEASGVAIPTRKADFSGFTDYGKLILKYMQEAGIDVDTCPNAIIDAWEMPEIGEEPRCIHANTDDDPEDEMVILVSHLEGTLLATDVVVYDKPPDDEMRIAFESLPHYGSLLPDRTEKRSLLATGDINGDGLGEMVFVSYTCVLASCQPDLYVVGGRRGNDLYVDLGRTTETEREPYGVAVSVEDLDGDGTSEIVVQGSATDDPYAPGTPYRRVYRWDGARYAPEPPSA
jgi:hypothetical protein